MDKYGDGLCARNFFTFTVVTTQVVGVVFVVLVAVWMGNFQGGFEWDTQKVFNYHPLFMSVGMIFLYGDAILVYRVFGTMKRTAVKILHASLLLLSLVFAIFGLVAVFREHAMENGANLYSLHSWIGLLCIILFAMQWVCGLGLLMFNQCARFSRRLYLPLHTFFGGVIFALAVCAALMGVLENVEFSLGRKYSSLPSEGLVANFAGLFMVIFAVLVFYLLIVARRPRATIEEDEMQLDETAGVNSGDRAADYGGASQ